MKRISIILILVVIATIVSTTIALADKPVDFDPEGNEVAWKEVAPSCVKIQDGILTYSAGHYLEGELLMTGYDEYGYNYQGHMYKGSYANVYLGGAGFPPYLGDDETYLAENPAAASNWAWPYRSVQLLICLLYTSPSPRDRS